MADQILRLGLWLLICSAAEAYFAQTVNRSLASLSMLLPP